MKHEGFKDKLYNNDIDIRQRLFVLNSLITEILLVVSLIEIFLTDDRLLDRILIGVAILFVFAIAIFSVKKKKIKFGASMICFMLGFIFFPMTFIYGGGINGDAPIWFIYTILVISILLDGKTRIVFYVLELLVATGCYYINIMHPEIVVESSRIMGNVFSYVSLVLISLAISVLVGLEVRLFTKEKKRAEEQKKEIEMLNAAQNQFFSSMSHEIRTPINTIIGLNEMILRENINDEVVEDAVNIRAYPKGGRGAVFPVEGGGEVLHHLASDPFAEAIDYERAARAFRRSIREIHHPVQSDERMAYVFSGPFKVRVVQQVHLPACDSLEDFCVVIQLCSGRVPVRRPFIACSVMGDVVHILVHRAHGFQDGLRQGFAIVFKKHERHQGVAVAPDVPVVLLRPFCSACHPFERRIVHIWIEHLDLQFMAQAAGDFRIHLVELILHEIVDPRHQLPHLRLAQVQNRLQVSRKGSFGALLDNMGVG